MDRTTGSIICSSIKPVALFDRASSGLTDISAWLARALTHHLPRVDDT